MTTEFLNELRKIGLDFAMKIPAGSTVICYGDPSTKGVTQAGRIYKDPTDHHIIVKYTLFEGTVPEDGLSGVFGPDSLTLE